MMETNTKHVVVAMSGGVDSSTVAALLKEQGYRVTGIMLRLWSEDGKEEKNRCCTPDSVFAAKRVAAMLGIPFYVIDAKMDFYNHVVQYFLDGYSAGTTPNPCVVCNKTIRWGKLLDHAIELGGDYFATGHYARLLSEIDGNVHLHSGIDNSKDQSYVLSMLDQRQLQKTLLPLGSMTKNEVRACALRMKLPSAEKPDSQDLCFLGDEDYRAFLQRYRPESLTPGAIMTASGEVIGQHTGLAAYTVGQRKGIGISDRVPYYVVAKDAEKNVLIVGKSEDLQTRQFYARNFNWINGLPGDIELTADVMVRYRAIRSTADISVIDGNSVLIHLREPRRDIAQGQLAVLYSGDEILGGGIIQYEVKT